MMQQVTRFTSTIDNKTSHWIVESDTTLEIAEKMCMQFMQQLGSIKAQQEALKAAQTPVTEDKVPDGECCNIESEESCDVEC
jgi:hypothetical protein